ncbi:MAG TPA: prepilin-type N-terminal cleavage/methylation domain-containing protein [Thermoanaerobaculia bacterium]|nr:prepilin-type N-terminal cleavage/methylation domain-containing protein [Thermoanaerobaculia bacterium]HUM31038.1 prepilin-type N-terminal cleavage/methylation domain-containing protein [Thermoanaerobaculia bacterium]HXK69336.1 prepilin-type N-terminal cleavage/methylation domain-containing protein [Thermoanaerobaculia bacterium]
MRRHRHGFTLIEVLVAITIFTILMIAALKVYDQSQRSFILGEQQSDVQQNLRFAFEKVTGELRLAGFDFNHDADAMRPDEQLEGIWPGAIVFRANYDPSNDETKNDSAPTYIDKNDPLFSVVTTTNEEIHAFVLSKDPSQALAGSNEKIEFWADTSKPRDATLTTMANQEKITISNISLTQSKPPYTLYLVTFPDADEPSTPVFTPLASNIFSMKFTYFDQWGVDPTHEIDPMNYDGNEVTGLESDTARKARGYIFNSGTDTPFVKNVVVELTGMVSRPDGDYVDPQDTNNDTKHYRKYTLSGTVQMFNIGVIPHELEDITKPYPPTNLASYPGYCNGILVSFTPSPSSDVTQYVFQWRDSSSTYTQPFPEDDPAHTYYTSSWDFVGTSAWVFLPARLNSFDPTSGQAIFDHFINGVSYTMRAFAIDGAGNYSDDASNESTVILDPNPPKPNPTTTIFSEEVVGTDGFNHAQVVWTTTCGYESCAVTADPNPTNGIRDFLGFRVYRLYEPDDDPNLDGTYDLLAKEQEVRGVRFIDAQACPCEKYGYKVQTVTNCQDNYDDNVCTGGTGISTLSDRVVVTTPDLTADGSEIPVKPAVAYATYENLSMTEEYTVMLHWEPVHKTTPSDLDIDVKKYYIYEAGPLPYGDPVPDMPTDPIDLDGDPSDGYIKPAAIDPNLTSVDFDLTSVIGNRTIPANHRMFYWVRPIFDCSTVVLGEASDPVSVPCYATWSAVITYPANDNDTVTGLVNIQMTLTNPDSVLMDYVKIRIKNQSNNAYVLDTDMVDPDADGIYEAAWDTAALFAGTYEISVTIMDANKCFLELKRYVQILQACTVLITPEDICSDDPRAVCFTIQAPPDKPYFVDAFTFAASANYRLLAVWGTAGTTTYVLWESTHPQGTDISGGLTIGTFTQTNYPADPGLFKLSVPSNLTEYRLIFGDPIDAGTGTLNLYLGQIDLRGATNVANQCVMSTGTVTFDKNNQNDWVSFGTPPVCGGVGNPDVPCCSVPTVYEGGTLLTSGTYYTVNYLNGTITWEPLIPKKGSESHALTIYYFNDVLDITWEYYVCTNIPLLLGP